MVRDLEFGYSQEGSVSPRPVYTVVQVCVSGIPRRSHHGLKAVWNIQEQAVGHIYSCQHSPIGQLKLASGWWMNFVTRRKKYVT